MSPNPYGKKHMMGFPNEMQQESAKFLAKHVRGHHRDNLMKPFILCQFCNYVHYDGI